MLQVAQRRAAIKAAPLRRHLEVPRQLSQELCIAVGVPLPASKIGTGAGLNRLQVPADTLALLQVAYSVRTPAQPACAMQGECATLYATYMPKDRLSGTPGTMRDSSKSC